MAGRTGDHQKLGIDGRPIANLMRLAGVHGNAKVLGVSRQALSRLINGQAGISPDMAIRLSKAFASTPDIWIRMQASYDIARAKGREDQINVERYQPRSAA